MATSIFDDRSQVPDEVMLARVLGDSAKHYGEMISYMEDRYGALSREWKFYGKNSGWTMKMIRGTRNLLFFIPQEGYFRLAFTFGDKAVGKIMESDVPQTLKDELAGAVKYAEGRGLQLTVAAPEDLDAAKMLIDIKAEN